MGTGPVSCQHTIVSNVSKSARNPGATETLADIAQGSPLIERTPQDNNTPSQQLCQPLTRPLELVHHGPPLPPSPIQGSSAFARLDSIVRVWTGQPCVHCGRVRDPPLRGGRLRWGTGWVGSAPRVSTSHLWFLPRRATSNTFTGCSKQTTTQPRKKETNIQISCRDNHQPSDLAS